MEKKEKKEKKEEEEEEEVEEIEEEEEFEDVVGEDFSKDARAMTYLQDAGRIADEVLTDVISKCIPGAALYDLCSKADLMIMDKLSKVYRKRKFMKGIAFPTCISVNEICGNFSASSEPGDDPREKRCLEKGDVAKIDLGVEICGFAAVVAHTVVVGEDKVTGPKADAILAAYNSIQAGLRMMEEKAATNNDITKTTEKICLDYKVNPVEGVLSHRMRKEIIDGMETIINKTTFEQKVENRQFEFGDVFGFDVMVSTGEGKPRETGIKTNIYKRALETTYKLRTDSARKLLSIVETNFSAFPFSFNQFDDEKNLKLKSPVEKLKTTMKLGLGECVKYELLHAYPVLAEKPGEIVAQFKYTVAVQKGKPVIICGLPIDLTKYESDKKITSEEINKLISSNLDDYLPNYKKSVKIQKKKKDNKAKRAAKKAAKAKRKEEEAKKKEAEAKK
ncbi:MAG: M24 family metallopeptidase [archaeon]|nr:M24 family metallopeptidase [archaeon]